MTASNPPGSDKPKNNSLTLRLRPKPVVEVETLVGRIYPYPLRVRDMIDFGKLGLARKERL